MRASSLPTAMSSASWSSRNDGSRESIPSGDLFPTKAASQGRGEERGPALGWLGADFVLIRRPLCEPVAHLAFDRRERYFRLMHRDFEAQLADFAPKSPKF